MPSSGVSALDSEEEGRSNVGKTKENPSFFDIYGTDVCIFSSSFSYPIYFFQILQAVASSFYSSITVVVILLEFYVLKQYRNG